MMITTFHSITALFLLLIIATVAAEVDIANCGQLTCEHGANCIEDAPDYSDHQLPDGSFFEIHSGNNAAHCACPVGFTGLSCDAGYKSCDGSTHKCYNGGECILGLLDIYDNEQLYCNCDRAQDDDGSRYVGKYCEQKSMTYCDLEDTARFCLNAGDCNTKYPDVGKSCNCADGFEGPHCEYVVDTVPACDLDCQNGGHCTLGIPRDGDIDTNLDYWNVQNNANDSKQYCKCEEGFHGQFCEVSSEPCGEGLCFHGALCILSVLNNPDSRQCDCRFSNTADKSYAGLSCQYEATQYCDNEADGLNGNLFCVNDGTCQQDAYKGCVCSEGYRGFSCEFYLVDPANDGNSTSPLPDDGEDTANGGNSTSPLPDDVEGTAYSGNSDSPPPDNVEDTTCTLDCNGQGTCRDGIKQKPSDEIVGAAEHLIDDEALSSELFEHCVCKTGFTGLQCEHKAEKCPGGDYHCFHGSECYTFEDEQKCDCSTANSTELGTSVFAGEQCQHPATQICTKGGEKSNLPSEGLSFCVNHGTCKSIVEEGMPHPGCTCTESKWTGPHCEIKIAQKEETVPAPVPAPAPLIKDDDDKSGSEVFSAILLSGAVLVVAAVILYALKTCCKSSTKQERIMEKKWGSNRNLGGYRDEPINSVNLSPQRESDTIQFHASSSRDPFASHLAPLPLLPLNAAMAQDNGPQVFLGPPQDEDGHVLHSVEII